MLYSAGLGQFGLDLYIRPEYLYVLSFQENRFYLIKITWWKDKNEWAFALNFIKKKIKNEKFIMKSEAYDIININEWIS